MQYNLFQPTYTDRKTGESRRSDTYHIRFRDHLKRRQTIAGSTREAETHTLAGRIMELVRHRQSGEPLSAKLLKWLSVQPERLRKRLEEMELIDPQSASAERPLKEHLDGVFSPDEKLITPGYKHALAARGNTAAHVTLTTDRVRRVLDGCGFVYWRDLMLPGAMTRVEVFLGEKRAKGEFTGATYNYHVRELKSFCRWLHSSGNAPAVAMDALEKVKNTETDAAQRRPLSTEEMHLLLSATINGPARNGVSPEDRAMLYRFAFETGLRTGQIRALKVSDFNLSADPPTVTTAAKYVKRRRVHTQALRPALAGELRKRFATKMPDAKAFHVPDFHNAEMLRDDLAVARQSWIEAAPDAQEREQRHRSDFLAEVNHAGERAVFYSMRHGHGTALAQAGVPEKDIAKSMHHASRTTTARYYLHADQKSLARAIATLPDLAYPQRQAATGTDGKPADPNIQDCLRSACATGQTGMESGGQSEAPESDAKETENTGKSENSRELCEVGPRGGMADASDLKSGGHPSKPSRNTALSENQIPCLRNACADDKPSHPGIVADDPELAEIVQAWPALSAKVRRALLALVRGVGTRR